MDWLSRLFTTDVLSLLIPIVAIVGVFAIAGLKAHHRHQERIEKIKQGLSPHD
ncbi:hypothetical protein [Thalassotalea ganghwensis]